MDVPEAICAICKANKNRKSLPCKHEFCINCLSILEMKKSYKCPICREAWKPQQLKDSIFLDIDSIQEKLKDMKLDAVVECSEHLKPLEVWCNDCEQLSCVKCLSAKHSAHNFKPVDECVQVIKTYLQDEYRKKKNLVESRIIAHQDRKMQLDKLKGQAVELLSSIKEDKSNLKEACEIDIKYLFDSKQITYLLLKANASNIAGVLIKCLDIINAAPKQEFPKLTSDDMVSNLMLHKTVVKRMEEKIKQASEEVELDYQHQLEDTRKKNEAEEGRHMLEINKLRAERDRSHDIAKNFGHRINALEFDLRMQESEMETKDDEIDELTRIVNRRSDNYFPTEMTMGAPDFYSGGYQRHYDYDEQQPSSHGNWQPYSHGNWQPYSHSNWQPYSHENWQPYSHENWQPFSHENWQPFSHRNCHPSSHCNQQPDYFDDQQPDYFDDQQPDDFDDEQPVDIDDEQPVDIDDEQPDDFDDQQPDDFDDQQPDGFDDEPSSHERCLPFSHRNCHSSSHCYWQPFSHGNQQPDDIDNQQPSANGMQQPAVHGKQPTAAYKNQQQLMYSYQLPAVHGNYHPFYTSNQQPIYTSNQQPNYTGNQIFVSASNQPPVSASNQPPVSASNQPPVSASYQPSVSASNQPPVSASNQPPVSASNQPSVSASN